MKILSPFSPSKRRRVLYGLPDLGALDCTSAPYFDKAGAIATRLRQIAAKARNDHLQPFYSIRAVADRFHVPPATISRIYRQLSSEKLLRMVWGSKTLLEPAESASSECRGVGIAVNLSRFVTSPDYRMSILTLQTEMWNHAVTEHLLFFEIQPDEVVHICTRNHHPDIDVVVWPWVDPLDKHALLRLHDLGIRIVCLSDHLIPGISECYIISRRRTIRTIVRKEILRV